MALPTAAPVEELTVDELAAYALATHVVHSWFPPEKRALPAGVVSAGSSVGPLIAAPVLTLVIATWDWHAAFLVLIVALWRKRRRHAIAMLRRGSAA